MWGPYDLASAAGGWCATPLPPLRLRLLPPPPHHPQVEVPTPRYVQRVHCEIDAKSAQANGQAWDFSEKTHVLKWKFRR